jgi:hypothetical protein
VVALTASAMIEEREPIMAAGCDDFLLKPFQEYEIFEIMAKHLGLKYVYAAESAQEIPLENESELRPEQLAALSEELQMALHNAVLGLDTVQTLEVISRIAQQDAAIANVLKSFVDKLEYENLLNLLEQISSERRA